MLISPVLEAAFQPEDGLVMCSLDRGGEELLPEPVRMEGPEGEWLLMGVERSDDDAHLDAENGGVSVRVRLSDGVLELAGAWPVPAMSGVEVESGPGGMTLRVT